MLLSHIFLICLFCFNNPYLTHITIPSQAFIILLYLTMKYHKIYCSPFFLVFVIFPILRLWFNEFSFGQSSSSGNFLSYRHGHILFEFFSVWKFLSITIAAAATTMYTALIHAVLGQRGYDREQSRSLPSWSLHFFCFLWLCFCVSEVDWLVLQKSKPLKFWRLQKKDNFLFCSYQVCCGSQRTHQGGCPLCDSSVLLSVSTQASWITTARGEGARKSHTTSKYFCPEVTLVFIYSSLDKKVTWPCQIAEV